MDDERYDLLKRMASSLGLDLRVGDTGEHGHISTVYVEPASDPDGPPESRIAEVSSHEIYTWLTAYEAAAQQLGKSQGA